MTVVYGVTFIGGRRMIEVQYLVTLYVISLAITIQKQLKDNIPQENLFQCSIYLIDLVFKSLAKMFSNAREIQVFLELYFS